MKKIIMAACGLFVLFTLQLNAQEKKEAGETTTETTEVKEKTEKKEIPAASFAIESSQENMNQQVEEMKKPTIYSYKAKTIDGNEIDFSKLKGKKVLIVNTASNCGYTPQYAQLEALHKKMGKNLIIIGFPSNDFGKQEPGTNSEIKTFCTKNYGVTFLMMEKIAVTGKEMHPVYQFLTQKSLNGVIDSKVEWNFQKYLINEKGELVKMFPSKVTPDDKELVEAIGRS